MITLLYTTHPDMKTAKEIAGVLLKKRLIACANFFPMESAYWWKGRIEETKEIVAILKTTEKNWKKVETEILKIHPYETPCIIKIDAKANEGYGKWAEGEIK